MAMNIGAMGAGTLPRSDTMKRPEAITFSSSWGNKFNKKEYTTVRGQDTNFTLLKTYPVILKGKLIGYAKVKEIEFKRINEFTIKEIREDLGISIQNNLKGDVIAQDIREQFMSILEKWYKQKPYWMGEYTLMQKLYLENKGKVI